MKLGLGLGVTAIRRQAAGPTVQTLTVSIAASNQDAREVIATTVVTLNDTTLALSSVRLNGFYFDVTGLPHGADVEGAAALGFLSQIQFTAAASLATTSALTIACQDADNAAVFVASNTNLSARILGNTVPWAAGPWTSGDRGAAQLSPDLSPIIQPVVDRVGFTGPGLVFIFANGNANSPTVAAEDHATLLPATLTVRYLI